jgi:F-type H+-transporting ATPase subunit b
MTMEFLQDPEFWVAVSFFLFIGLILYLQVHKKLGAVLDARAEQIAKEIDQARSLREEAQAVLADYRRKQGNVEKETKAIVDLAMKEARLLAAETQSSMKEHFERRMKLAEDKIGRAEQDAVRDVRAAAVNAAVGAAETVIAAKLSPEKAGKLVSDSIAALKSKLN